MRTGTRVVVMAAVLGLMGPALPSIAVAAGSGGVTARAATVSAGGSHTCAVTDAGAVACWGNNGNGQLGDGTTTNSSVPVDVVGLGSGAVAVSGSTSGHTCAVTTAGAVKCWGNNAHGELGNGTTTGSSVPVDVVGLGSGAAAVSTGVQGSCAVTTAGAVKCWGWNAKGQLGNGTTTGSSVPVDVVGLGSGAAAVSAGWSRSCALTTAGAVTCWGDNSDGALGDGTTTDSSVPVDVVGLGSGAAAVSAGDSSFCALTTAGAVTCWGSNRNGQLGIGTTTIPRSSVPVDVVGLGSGAVAVSSSCAVTTAGAVKCWGRDGNGELGNGIIRNSSVPVDVVGLGSGAVAVSSGGLHSCALSTAGAVKCWGYNAYGELGNGTTTNSLAVYVVGFGAPVITRLSDFNGDGFTDLFARDTAGRLWLYPGNGAGSFKTRFQIGVGWNTFSAIVAPGDVTGDGIADILARDVAGRLWLYPGDHTSSFSARRQIGSGWNVMNAITNAGDLNGAGRPDLLARDSAGALWLYPLSGNAVFGTRTKLGTGWAGYTIRGPGDFSGDGRADILARDSAGALWLYRGNGTGGLTARTRVGIGWQAMTALITPGNWDRTAGNDVLARDSAGRLWFYPANDGGGLGSRRQIGSGWNGLTYIS